MYSGIAPWSTFRPAMPAGRNHAVPYRDILEAMTTAGDPVPTRADGSPGRFARRRQAATHPARVQNSRISIAHTGSVPPQPNAGSTTHADEVTAIWVNNLCRWFRLALGYDPRDRGLLDARPVQCGREAGSRSGDWAYRYALMSAIRSVPAEV